MSILNYPNAGTLGENDFFYVVQNGLDKKATFKQLPIVTNSTDGLMSKEDKITLSKEVLAYNFDLGLLVKTNIPSDSNTMFIVEFTVNSYTDKSPQKSIIQGYCYGNENKIIHAKGAIICGNPVVVRCFIHSGHLCFWTKQTNNFQTFIVNIKTNIKEFYISGFENVIMPTNVSRLIEISPVRTTFSEPQTLNTQRITPPCKFYANKLDFKQLCRRICEKYRNTG